ncbi:RNA polymerase sigma factor [Alcanivorax sp. 24]|uniref:RNA polymerase sigma factor n=1 Tax=Alcanivorax sp. 24 TaxID=2545266 RepID=UPI00105EAB40|nr:sigma-70 family RNA polymerase sigma factor [Alcanivorax sp. 24]
MENIENPEFVARLRSGDDTAFALLVKHYHPRLLSTARSLLQPADAEEAVQEGWISAHRALPRFEGRSTVLTWLTRIVINQARMQLRRAGREIQFDPTADDVLSHRFNEDGRWQLPPHKWDMQGPDSLLTRDELKDCMEKHMHVMPDSQRLVLELRDIQGQDFDTICNILEISTSNVRVLLHRARTRLFQMVDHFQETGEC